MTKKDLSPLAFTRAGKYKSKSATQEQKDITKALYNRVNKRLKNVAKHKELPQIARERFDENVRGKLRNLDDMTKREVTSLYEELHYIDSLKSSSVKGGKEMNAIGRELMGESYSSLKQGQQSALWELVNKVREEAKTSGRGSMGSLEAITDIRVAKESGNIQFRQLRDKRGRFTSKYEAYFVDSSGNVMDISTFNSEMPIDLEKRSEEWKKLNKTRNERLLRGF